jgi:hypothetical protein
VIIELAGIKELASGFKIASKGIYRWLANDIALDELHRFAHTTAIDGVADIITSGLIGGKNAAIPNVILGGTGAATGLGSVGDAFRSELWSFVPVVGTIRDVIGAVNTCTD